MRSLESNSASLGIWLPSWIYMLLDLLLNQRQKSRNFELNMDIYETNICLDLCREKRNLLKKQTPWMHRKSLLLYINIKVSSYSFDPSIGILTVIQTNRQINQSWSESG